jgi:hypothetical protein
MNRLLSLIRHGPHWKRRVQKFFYWCVCIRYRGKVSTKRLPSNDERILPSRCLTNDKMIFTDLLPRNDRGANTDTHTQRQQRDLISLPYFFQYKDSRLKKTVGAFETIRCKYAPNTMPVLSHGIQFLKNRGKNSHKIWHLEHLVKSFCLLHSVQTGSGAHPASCTMRTGALSPGVKWPGTWSWPLTSN